MSLANWDAGVGCYIYLAEALLRLGYADQAAEQMQTALLIGYGYHRLLLCDIDAMGRHLEPVLREFDDILRQDEAAEEGPYLWLKIALSQIECDARRSIFDGCTNKGVLVHLRDSRCQLHPHCNRHPISFVTTDWPWDKLRRG